MKYSPRTLVLSVLTALIGISAVVAAGQDLPPGGVEERIRSEEYSTAEAALNDAILERNEIAIQSCLKCRSFRLRIRAAEALADLGYNSSVCTLLDALKLNQGAIDGGSETQGLQNLFNKAIVAALEKLTTMKFKVSHRIASKLISSYSPFSPEEMKEIISKTKEWCDPSKSQF